MGRKFLFFTALFFSISASAISLNQAYEALKFSEANIAPEGAICEQVARLELLEEYPADRFDIEMGIEYTDGRKSYGELDVVIFDKPSKKAILVAEVKCWKSFKGGLKKAREQRARFLRALQSGSSLSLKSADYSFQRSQFEGLNQFISIAQKGAVAEGFDRELEMSMKDLDQLRRQVETCQTYKNCK